MELRFVESESTFSCFAATASYLQRHGKPVALYSDKRTTFRVAVFGGCQLEVGEVPSKDEIIKRVLSASRAEGSVSIGVGTPVVPPSVPPPVPPTDGSV